MNTTREITFLLLFTSLACPAVAEDGLGISTLRFPDGNWNAETVTSRTESCRVVIYTNAKQPTERIIVLRFKKTSPAGELTLARSYAYCDMVADSLSEGVPPHVEIRPDGTRNDEYQYGTGHMILLPRKGDREPLSVTNIYTTHSGTKWMNHGLIASDDAFVFLFVHSSTGIITPDAIRDVYASAKLKRWPRAQKGGG